jgi:DNA-binding response OmpR family regulator
VRQLQVLIVEDQRDIASNIADFFADDDWQLDFAYDGNQGLALALRNFYDVIVLDLMLPGLDGLSVCEQLRLQADRHIPIIMLTARDSTDDKVSGFRSGADDYLTKPFSMQELQYRCLALARRHLLSRDHELQVGDVSINRQTKVVTRAGQRLSLHPIAFEILQQLADAYPRVVSRTELVQKIWGDESTDSDTLRSHIYQLRQQLDKPFETPVLKTVHGVGFVLQSTTDP